MVQHSEPVDVTADRLTMAGFEVEDVQAAEDPVLDVKVMSNRGDGLNAYGLARELIATGSAPTDLFRACATRFAGVPLGASPSLPISIETPRCTRYAGLTIRGIQPSETPEWVRARLEAAGMRPVHLVVDLANYVMLEMGQPLHTFDLARLPSPEIRVRDSHPGETIRTLDDQLRRQEIPTVLICAGEQPVAIGGIMGGLESEAQPNSTAIFLESAHFEPMAIRRSRKKLGLSTEASYRFERWVDPESVPAGARRFVELLRSLQPGIEVSSLNDVDPRPAEPRAIRLRPGRINALLGVEVPEQAAEQALVLLGGGVSHIGDAWQVTAPSWRPDWVREEDLVEEVARVVGYDSIPECLPVGQAVLGGIQGEYRQRMRLREAALRCGVSEVVSHSLAAASPLDDPARPIIGLREPGSPELANLRNSILPGLAQAAQRNGGRDLALFEMGRVFSGPTSAPQERSSMAVLLCGAVAPSDRRQAPREEADFFALKGIVEEILAAGGVGAEYRADEIDPRFHPTRQARIAVGSQLVGVLGAIHPVAARELRLEAETYLAELDVDAVVRAAPKELRVQRFSRNPAIRRDIAIEIEKGVAYRRIESTVREAAGTDLERVWLFDVYEGTGVPHGSHSLGIALQLRREGVNFTDEQANQVRDAVVAALESLGAKRR